MIRSYWSRQAHLIVESYDTDARKIVEVALMMWLTDALGSRAAYDHLAIFAMKIPVMPETLL